MSHLNVEDAEDVVQCPYDDTHMIRRSRYQYHLIKCGKNHPDKKFEICPFNARHRVPKNQLRMHMQTCPDSCLIQRDAMHQAVIEGETPHGDCSLPVYEPKHCSEENWDDDAVRAEPFIFGKSSSAVLQNRQQTSNSVSQRAPSTLPQCMKELPKGTVGVGIGRGVPIARNNSVEVRGPGEQRRRVNVPLGALATPDKQSNPVTINHQPSNHKVGRVPVSQMITPFGIAPGSGNYTISMSDGSDDELEVDIASKLRKIKKKLRQVELLDEKQLCGIALDQDQQQKLATKFELLSLKAKLQMELDEQESNKASAF